MNIKSLFETKAEKLLNIYITAGFPKLNSLEQIIPALSNAGTDIIEIGIPYSDPISDGPTIQMSNAQAINNGITLEAIFNQLEKIEVNTPLVLMGYFNSILQFGIKEFCKQCKNVGVSGLIIPDLPIDVYLKKYQSTFVENELSNIFLITPETSEERIQFIDRHSSSFIFAVSSSSTTGNSKNIEDSQEYLQGLKEMNLNTSILVGFNIRNRSNYEFVSQYASGAIIGSAFIKHINNSQDIIDDVSNFVKNIK